jgi:hypothetical protein
VLSRKEGQFRLTSTFQKKGTPDCLIIQEVGDRYCLASTPFSESLDSSDVRRILEHGGVPLLLCTLTTAFAGSID